MPSPHLPASAAVDEVTAAFADAINSRRPVPALVPLSSTSIRLPPTPTTSTAAIHTSPASFSDIPTSELHTVLSVDGILILDIRTHNAYSQGRLPNALSLSVPSTLLKRPGFSLAKLAQMMPSPAARDRFAEWHNASRILVYDADSATLAEGGNVLGLLRKFRNEGYSRDVAFVKGGYHAVSRDVPSFIDTQPPPREDDDDGLPPMTKSISAPGAAPALRARHLPMSAFTLSSTAGASQPSLSLSQRRSMQLHSLSQSQSETSTHAHTQLIPPTPMSIRADPFSTLALPPSTSVSSSLRLPPTREGVATMAFPQFPAQMSLPTLSPQPGFHPRPHHTSLPPAPAMAFNPFFDNIRQNMELRGLEAGPGGSSSNGIPLKLPRRVRRRLGDLPFEWLRQIARRSGKVRGERTSDEDSDMSDTGNGNSDADARDSISTTPSNSSAEDLTRSLASQFYKIELGEQKRLMGVMEHHSKESGAVMSASSAVGGAPGLTMSASGYVVPAPLTTAPTLVGAGRSVSFSGSLSGPVAGVFGVDNSRPPMAVLRDKDKETRGSGKIEEEIALPVFPYSITAGIEKGTKNRYRNIWPFEHARVRLMRKLSNGEEDDYMNASYVQPLGTTKRYIATQGPLPATFNDFWTLCWEQNVHVIVMLTREVESATIKCGNYWVNGTYGPLKLTLRETTDTPESERKRREKETSSGFFNLTVPEPDSTTTKKAKKGKSKSWRKGGLTHDTDDAGSDAPPAHTIRRVFSLEHTGYPLAPPRTVVQLQYLEWPDMNVPDDPRGLLQLIREVGNAAAGTMEVGDRQWGEGPMSREEVEDFARAVGGPGGLAGMGVPSDGLEDGEGAESETEGMEPHVGPQGQDGNARAGEDQGEDQDLEESGEGELDPRTGVAKRALGNSPVLLHCSAGVGRTGGFIAVDSVLDGIRREMRKRVDDSVGVGRDSDGLDGSGSGSGSPLRMDSSSPPRETEDSRSSTGEGEPMEVDSSSSPSPPRVQPSPSPADVAALATSAATTGLTMPMSVGRNEVNEVHVPVAGFSVPIPMDVDSDVTGVAAVAVAEPARPGLPHKGSVMASPELVSEVKRATLLNRMHPPPLSSSHHHPQQQQVLSHPHSQPHHLQAGGGPIAAPGMGLTGSSTVPSPHMEIVSPVPAHAHVRQPPASISSSFTSSSESKSHPTTSTSESLSASYSRRSMVGVSQSGTGTGSTSVLGSRSDLAANVDGKGKGNGKMESASEVLSSSVSPVGGASRASTSSSSGGATGLVMAGLSLGEKGEATHARARTSSSSLSLANAPLSAAAIKGSVTAIANRLDDWRSEVRNSQAQDGSARSDSERRREHGHSSSASSPGRSPSSPQLPLPRRLHDDSSSPPLLSTYDEPVRRIVEDMREQRMSLCQSLRQYVFVHRAIVEGALMIVDEERTKRAREEEAERSSSSPPTKTKTIRSHGAFLPDASSLRSAFVLRGDGEKKLKEKVPGGGSHPLQVLVDPHLRAKKSAEFESSQHSSSSVVSFASSPSGVSVSSSPPGLMVSPGRSKRGASPTELLKEGTGGEVLLTKRPSIKRRQRSSDEEEEEVSRGKHPHSSPAHPLVHPHGHGHTHTRSHTPTQSR